MNQQFYEDLFKAIGRPSADMRSGMIDPYKPGSLFKRLIVDWVDQDGLVHRVKLDATDVSNDQLP